MLEYITYKPLNRDEQRRLCELRDAGDESAAWELALSVQPLARKLSARFCRGRGWDDYDAAESAAMRGAHRAATKLDPDVASITTYASNWILDFVHREWQRLAHGVIWVPPNNGGPCDAEAGELASNVLSLEFDDGNPNLQPLDDADPCLVVEACEQRSIEAAKVWAALELIEERLAIVLRRRLMDGHKQADIASDLGLSTQRVSQLEAKAKDAFKYALETGKPPPAPKCGPRPKRPAI